MLVDVEIYLLNQTNKVVFYKQWSKLLAKFVFKIIIIIKNIYTAQSH